MVTCAGRKPVQRLRSDSSDSASSSEASDSDSDEAPFAKKKCPNSRLNLSSSHVPPAAARPPTKHSIWTSVLQEQTLAKDLGSWFGMKSKVISDRDVETYDYRSAKKDLAEKNSAGPVDTDQSSAVAVDIDIADDCDGLQPDDENVNICDHETFGTSASATFSNNRTKSSEKNCDDDERLSRKRRHSGTTAGSNRQLLTATDVNRQSARNRLSKRTYDKDKDRSHIHVDIGDTAPSVGQELVRVLREPEHMKDTFGNFSQNLYKFVNIYYVL